MKTPPAYILPLVALFVLPSAVVRGDAATHAQLLKERDEVLAQIVSQEVGKAASGVGDEAAIFAAKMALLSFRRDAAGTKEEKQKQQLLIVGMLEQQLAEVKAQAKTGVVSSVAVLKATDAVLAAKQLLEELKGDGKPG